MDKSACSSTDRASDYGSEGLGFESLQAHRSKKPQVSPLTCGFVVGGLALGWSRSARGGVTRLKHPATRLLMADWSSSDGVAIAGSNATASTVRGPRTTPPASGSCPSSWVLSAKAGPITDTPATPLIVCQCPANQHSPVEIGPLPLPLMVNLVTTKSLRCSHWASEALMFILLTIRIMAADGPPRTGSNVHLVDH